MNPWFYKRMTEGIWDKIKSQADYEVWSLRPEAVKAGGRLGVWFENLLDGLRKHERAIKKLYYRMKQDLDLVATVLEELKVLSERRLPTIPVPDDLSGAEDEQELHQALLRNPLNNVLIRAMYIAFFDGKIPTSGNIYLLALASLKVLSDDPSMSYTLQRMTWREFVDALDDVL